MENSSPTTPPTTNSLMKPASQEANCYPPIFSPIPTLGTTHLEVNSMTNQVTNQTIQVIRPPFYPHFSLPNTTNNLGNPAIQGTQTPFYGEYMHGYPPFVSCINTKPSWTTSQESVDAPCLSSRSPMICLTSTNVVEEVQDASRVEYSDPKSRTKSVESEDVEDSRTQSNLHSEVEGSIEEPKLGMVFTSDQDLFSYYKSYGKQCGFPVVTLRSRKTDDGKLKYVTIGCARAGKPRNRTSNVMRPRPTSKTDCKVKINATCIEGVWKVLTVDNTHNHDLSPKKSRFFSCNREVSESVKRQLDTNDQAGIRVNKSFTAIMQEAGGYEELSFTEKDCRNYIDKARQLRLGKGGAEALRGYFERMQEKNDGFFSCMDLDDDSRLRNIFWADARSRASYKYFGDVVTFDATYLTNRYEMPFTPFVGVNHHGQSILLGAGLLWADKEDMHKGIASQQGMVP